MTPPRRKKTPPGASHLPPPATPPRTTPSSLHHPGCLPHTQLWVAVVGSRSGHSRANFKKKRVLPEPIANKHRFCNTLPAPSLGEGPLLPLGWWGHGPHWATARGAFADMGCPAGGGGGLPLCKDWSHGGLLGLPKNTNQVYPYTQSRFCLSPSSVKVWN